MTTTNPTGRPAEKRYEMGGQMFALSDLAALAQCSLQTMSRRLSRRTAENAVAMGKADKNRLRGSREHFNTPTGMHPATKFYALGHERLTLAELAERAGCSKATMISRLRHNAPSAAVAMGAPDLHRPRKIAPPKVRDEPAPRLKPAATARPTKTTSSERLTVKSWAAVEKKKADKKTAAPTGPVIVPKGLEVQRAEPKHGRFYVDPKNVPSHFGRIGQYEDTGSALERAYGGGR